MEKEGGVSTDYPVTVADESFSSVIFDRIHEAEVRLAMAVSQLGNQALSLYVAEQAYKRQELVRYAGELMIVAGQVLTDSPGGGIIWQLDRSLELETQQEAAKKILRQITPLSMYEVLTALAAGSSRDQVSAEFSMTNEEIARGMQKIYELFEVNKPSEALKAIEELSRLAGYDPDSVRPEVAIDEDPRSNLEEPLSQLTDTELDILGCVCHGLLNKQIARLRFVEEQTIKFHLGNIYRKLEVSNRTAAATLASREGLIEWALAFQSQGVMPVTVTVVTEKRQAGKP